MVLKAVTVRSIDTIDAITFVYVDGNGKEHKVGPWGGTLGSDHTLTLNSLTFVTSRGNRYVFGTVGANDTKFNVPLEKGSIAGFYARADNFVSAIGFYARP
ncbi:hypothetical protein ABZP36_015880 [Zizania latifolia]